MATSLYVDNVQVTSSSGSMGTINYNSTNMINVRISGLQYPFNTQKYTRWGISFSPLTADGTTTEPNQIIHEHAAKASGSSYQSDDDISAYDFSYYCYNAGSNIFYVWVQTSSEAGSQYWYVGLGGFSLLYWKHYNTIDYTSGYRVPDNWLSESHSYRTAYAFSVIKFKSPITANYYFKAYASQDIILNYLGSGSSIPSFTIDSVGRCTQYADDSGSGGQEKYEFYGSANIYYWFAITGYNGAQFTSSYYLATRLWGQTTPSTEPFNGIDANVTDTYSLDQCTTVRYILKATNTGPVTISSYGTGAMAKVTTGTGTVDKTSGFYESGIVASDTSSGNLSLSFTATAGTTYYLWVRTYTYDDDGSITITVAPTTGGKVYIDTGSGFEEYSIYIDNGSSWDKYTAYIDNGSSWDKY